MATDVLIVQLPQRYEDKAQLRAYALKLRELRLHALRSNPEAFASSYETEVQFKAEEWEGRLVNPMARSFVALQKSVNDEESPKSDPTLVRSWVALVVLLGPKLYDGVYPTAAESPWKLFHDVQPHETIENLEAHNASKTILFSMNGVYVAPEVRGRSIGKRAINAAIQAGQKNIEGKAARAVCIIFVEKDNYSATALYEASGFRRMEEETYSLPNGKKGVGVGYRLDMR